MAALKNMIAEKAEDRAATSYVHELGRKIKRFLDELPSVEPRELGAIGPLDVREYFDKLGKSDGNKKAIKRNLSPLFTWAVEHGHMAANPWAGLRLGRQRNVGAKQVVNPDGEAVRVIRCKVVDQEGSQKPRPLPQRRIGGEAD